MRKLIIAATGDNDWLHERALEAAVEAVEKVNKASVYRAWIEPVDRAAVEVLMVGRKDLAAKVR